MMPKMPMPMPMPMPHKMCNASDPCSTTMMMMMPMHFKSTIDVGTILFEPWKVDNGAVGLYLLSLLVIFLWGILHDYLLLFESLSRIKLRRAQARLKYVSTHVKKTRTFQHSELQEGLISNTSIEVVLELKVLTLSLSQSVALSCLYTQLIFLPF